MLINKNPFLLLLMVFFFNCNAQSTSNNKVLKITYNAETRGSFINVLFENKNITFKKNNSTKTNQLTEIENEAIINALKEINLTEINSLKAPSDNRFSDGALSAKFIITKDDSVYTSSEFDHDNPPEELKYLFSLLIKYSS